MTRPKTHNRDIDLDAVTRERVEVIPWVINVLAKLNTSLQDTHRIRDWVQEVQTGDILGKTRDNRRDPVMGFIREHVIFPQEVTVQLDDQHLRAFLPTRLVVQDHLLKELTADTKMHRNGIVAFMEVGEFSLPLLEWVTDLQRMTTQNWGPGIGKDAFLVTIGQIDKEYGFGYGNGRGSRSRARKHEDA